ncbi:ClpP/crotonase-like domain-containing protein [Cladochytrium replicatum]|nr:ClpP/crotonase-like domain-containing protein [Cladochytrium replicatum]
MNPLTSSLGRSFKAACETLSRDNSVRTVVLTGAGDRAFSAGGDFDFLRERANTTPARNVQVMRDFYDLYLTSIRQIGVPTLAAINGHAVGAGLCLALACDMRIAHPNAKLGLNFVKLGLTPGMAGSHLLPYLLSHQNAAYLLLTGRLIPASEAKDMGLVLRTADDPLESALRIAKEIAENSPVAVRAVTKTLRMRWEDGIERGLAREADTQAIAYASEDFKEGLDAVANKRTATFKDF